MTNETTNGPSGYEQDAAAQPVIFALMGFELAVTASSATPQADGYVGTLSGMPYHVHPEATPDAFNALTAAIAANEVAVTPYVAPVVTLANAQAHKQEELRLACAAFVTSGFTSSALGVSTAYPSQQDDQSNLQSAALAASGQAASWTTPLWCEQGDTWSYVMHTATQVAQVNADWVRFRTAAQSQYASLLAQVASATTIERVRAIVWA